MSSEIRQEILQPNNLHYTVALPSAYSPEQPYPLVLALHFAGHGSPFYGGLILSELVEPALRELDAIILAPDCTGPDWTHPKSETDVIRLLDHVQETYHVDQSRTLITGYSMGGIGTWFFAMRHQDRFSSALIMAGLPPADIATIQWGIPLYVIQSRADQLMPLEPTEDAVEKLKSSGLPIEFVILDGITHFETWRYSEPLRDAVPWIRRTWEK
jgi:predicted peptidase